VSSIQVVTVIKPYKAFRDNMVILLITFFILQYEIPSPVSSL
jgi:hypothetical protein